MRSVEYLEAAARRDQPFFLWCSFPDPHHPFTPPGRFYDQYDPRAMPINIKLSSVLWRLPP